MKYYDFKKAIEILIEKKEQLTEASLGFHEDWFWTAEPVFENGEIAEKLFEESVVIGGIRGSIWATPTLQLNYKDGTEEMIEVSTGEWENTFADRVEQKFLWAGGCLSGPMQDNITPLKKE